MNIQPYLRRIGVVSDIEDTRDLDTLERIQRAHVRSVPFENFSIVGDPYGPYDGEEVILSLPALYEKIVERGRGGYCYELNGLFHWLLKELGYDVDRVAARVISGGEARPPANHLSLVVRLDRRYIVDVGLGHPKICRPIPIGTNDPIDDGSTEWRVVESDRPDEEYLVEACGPKDDSWQGRYYFTDTPRDLGYFRAINDYHQTAPESTFTGDPMVTIATEEGFVKISGDVLTVRENGEKTERSISTRDFYQTLERGFGIRFYRI